MQRITWDTTLDSAFLAIRAGQETHGVHGPDSRVLLELQGRQRAVGRPDLGAGVLHAVERLLPDAGRRCESFLGHRIRPVMSAALHHR